ncbi:MAG: peptidase domain-containing ABC transporter [Defluviitaleaceae bacterium]|nr:peptidase domain-containing ABC transporter [Defluviitaleaceae bacterium]
MKYYAIKQHDITDCGAACLATISKQHGLKLPIAQIREIAGTDKQGTNAYGIVKAAEELGFSAKAVKGDKEAFFTPFPLPCIAHVVVDGSLLHYVVIHKITKKQVIIADPGVGLLKLTPAEFFGEEKNGKPLSEGETPKYKWSGVLIFVVPGTTFEKGDKTLGIFRRFFHLLLPQKKLIIHVFVASIISVLLGILGAFYFRYLLDDILPGGLNSTLHIISIGVILLYVFRTLLDAFRSHLLLYLSQKIDISLLLSYYRHVLALPMNFFGTRRVGEIIARFNDAVHVREAISGATLTIMIDTVMVVAGGIILFNQNAYMFGVSVVVVVLYFITVFCFNKWYRRLNQRKMEDNAQLTSYLVESLNGIQTVKAYNAESEANLKTEKKFITLLGSIFKLSWVSNLQGSLNNLLESIGGIVILWVGALNVLNGNLTIGQLITFNALLVYFLDPVKNLINLQPMMQTAVVAADRLGEILDLPPEKQGNQSNKISPQSLTGDIQIKDVSFRYGTRKLVLEDVNITAKQGEKIAFVGESGSGKTTLAKLLLNLYTPEKGEILINDTNIKDIQIDTLREKIAYVPQETFLFSGTIMENLMLGLTDATPEEIIDAAKTAQAHDFVNNLPLRYETMLEENGTNLSGGQRQRLAITRAILRKPDILILDEATSNLDSITERAIESTIHEYSKGITTFIIAHRLSTIKRCDRIYIVNDGKIVESGTHEVLLGQKGYYYNLVASQSLEEAH